MKDKVDDRSPVPWYANFSTATGLALGELILLSGKPDDLEKAVRSILLSAHAVLLSPEHRSGAESVTGAALSVVRTWHEKTEDLAALGETIADLQEVLARLGMEYVPTSESPDSGKY